jgi:hypothetical protein
MHVRNLAWPLALATLLLCGCGKGNNSQTHSAASVAAAEPASYTPRIGIGVSTAARTCFAIHNGNLSVGSPVTLVSPLPPLMVVQATVGPVSQNQPCPIAQNVDTTVSNYNLDVNGSVPKLTPFIVLVGTPGVTTNSNNVAQTDLDQNGRTQTFRSCSADNGIHLTVWDGPPLTGKLLWHGSYYESTSPNVGPTCTAAEMPAM